MTEATAIKVRRTAGKAIINVALPVGAVIGLVQLLATHGVGLFVYRSDFNTYMAEQRYQHSRDSLIRGNEISGLQGEIGNLRNDIATLVRSCQRDLKCP